MRTLEELKGKKKDIEHEIVNEKYRLAKEFKQEHKWHIRILDIMLIIGILFNVGALLITNALVVKTAVESGVGTVFEEANPITAEAHNLKNTKAGIQQYYGMMITFTLYALLGIFYFLHRSFTRSTVDLMVLTALVIVINVLWGLDFIHDLGFYIGTAIYS